MQLTEEQIEFLDNVCPKKWKLNSEGKVDVEGNVDILNLDITEIPVKFGKVTGYFWCPDNKLTTLEGCPDVIGWTFMCYGNNLTNYFKTIKEEDFPHWGRTKWNILEDYPFLINIILKYHKRRVVDIINTYPQTKLYLE